MKIEFKVITFVNARKVILIINNIVSYVVINVRTAFNLKIFVNSVQI